jgi:hypothetical protein
MPLEADPQFYGVPHSIPSEGSLQKDFMGGAGNFSNFFRESSRWEGSSLGEH